MSDDKKRDEHWEGFEGQTRLKHYVLRAYLDRWSRVLIQAGNQRLVFVDAFAGRGRDKIGNPGSPLIAYEIAETIRSDFPGAEIQVIAIEASHENVVELQRNLDAVGAHITLLEGSLTDHIDSVLEMIGGDPALFFLDPWGVKGLSADVTKRLLDGEKREVLLLFDDDGAARVHAAAIAQPKARVTPAANMSLFGDDEAPEAMPKKGQSAESRAHSARATGDIIKEVFGSRYSIVESRIRNQSGITRRESLLAEYVELLKELGATHVLPFSVVDQDDRHHYYLVHASRHKKAFTVMKDAIRSALNRREKEPGIKQSFLFQSGADVGAAADAIDAHFAGQTNVRWQDGKKSGTVRVYAEEDTQLLHGDMSALKAELERRGRVIEPRQKALAYSFPPRTTQPRA